MNTSPKNFCWDRFNELPIVGILRGFSLAAIKEMIPIAHKAGLLNIEVTMNSENVSEQIKYLVSEFTGQMNIGAGTVTDMESLNLALNSGASYVVTPIVVPEVIKTCKSLGVPVFPGALTPTEIYTASQLGADMVKLFPASQLGVGYIKAVKGPFPEIKLLATGGVTVENAAEYKSAGVSGFGIGSPLFDKKKMADRDWEWLEKQVKRFKNVLNP
jgi:2-dehydro-3-deoxyphosphogluconate aldolase / (4S)-4-hydroxy-2-oxoglutarate aldolase